MRLDPGGDTEDGGLNLTPLIDVVFLLLIFFLTATTFQRDEVEKARSQLPGCAEHAGRLGR